MGAVFSLLLIVFISIVITKIATVALIHTGLSKETAQFQARSALTGVGFTTNESERLVNDPVRRRILMLLMIVGNAGIVTAMASLILTYVNTGEEVSIWWKTIVIVLGVGGLWFVAVSRTVNAALAWLISKLLKKYTKLSVHDFTSLLHLAKDYRVDEFLVEEQDWVANESLQNLQLAEEGLLVLGIERASGEYIGTPGGHTDIMAGDKLIIYGRAQNIIDLDNRRKGRSGDKSHFKSVRVQKHVEKIQEEPDPEKS
jgi:K+/H+ antiporter YhaU regulatory subunit KhtT